MPSYIFLHVIRNVRTCSRIFQTRFLNFFAAFADIAVLNLKLLDINLLWLYVYIILFACTIFITSGVVGCELSFSTVFRSEQKRKIKTVIYYIVHLFFIAQLRGRNIADMSPVVSTFFSTLSFLSLNPNNFTSHSRCHQLNYKQ